MKRLLSTVCAATLAVSFTVAGVVPATSAPVYVPTGSAVESNVVEVSDHRKRNRGGNWNRHDRDGKRHNFQRRGKNYYYRGHRGYSYHRPGYRRHGDLWFPLAAFAAGAIISGAVNQPRVIYRSNSYSSSHVEWCYDRYRSYRHSDNTFQPYHGPRKQCYSPYS